MSIERHLSASQARIALVYDRVNTRFGGAENVLLALKKIYPQAELFTSVYDKKQAKWANVFKVHCSFLQFLPFAYRLHRFLPSLMPLAFESIDLSKFDIIISVTSAEAKAVITRADQLHLCYLLSPPRYLYHYRQEYLEKFPLMRWPILNKIIIKQLDRLEKFDQISIHRPDVIVAISKIVAKRMERYYHLKPSTVLYPPVDTQLSQEFFINKNEIDLEAKDKSKYYLLVSRLVPYKNIDAAIIACINLKKKLIIVGSGPEEKNLKNLARKLERKNGFQTEELIIFKKNLHPKILAKSYLSCQAVISPGVDDYGISSLEGNLYGKAVLINELSGAAEIIKNGIHGLHIPFQEGDSLSSIIKNISQSILLFEQSHFNYQMISKNALKYDTNKFVLNFAKLVDELYQAKKRNHL